MSSVRDILEVLFELAPLHMKETWDNVGLVCGHDDAEVKKILVALDASEASLREAKECGCQLLVTHHPMIFGGIQQINGASAAGKHVLYAAENGIACVNMHTNLDCVPGGVNDILAAALGLGYPVVLAPKGQQDGQPYGYVRAGMVPECSLSDFVQQVRDALGCRGLRYANGGKPVRRVAVGGGACGDEVQTVLDAGCDTFVTADIKYHQFCDAAEMGLNLIDAGHFETEFGVCRLLAQTLCEAFPDVEVLISQTQKSPICFA